MRKILAFVLVLSLVFAFSAVAGAKYVDTDETGNATVKLDINSVVYINLLKTNEGTGFSEKEVKTGWAMFKNIHRLQVHSTTDYIVAANLINSAYQFNEVQLTDNYDESTVSNMSTVTNRDPSDWDFTHHMVYAKARWERGTVKAVKNTDSRAQTTQTWKGKPPVGSAKWWHLLNTNGYYRRDGSDGTTFEILCEGAPNTGDEKGDKAKIDYGLDLEWAKDNGYEMPSGTYTFDVEYLVMEQ